MPSRSDGRRFVERGGAATTGSRQVESIPRFWLLRPSLGLPLLVHPRRCSGKEEERGRIGAAHHPPSLWRDDWPRPRRKRLAVPAVPPVMKDRSCLLVLKHELSAAFTHHSGFGRFWAKGAGSSPIQAAPGLGERGSASDPVDGGRFAPLRPQTHFKRVRRQKIYTGDASPKVRSERKRTERLAQQPPASSPPGGELAEQSSLLEVHSVVICRCKEITLLRCWESGFLSSLLPLRGSSAPG